MYELTVKQKLTNYCYFVIFNSVLACVIGVGYWLFWGYSSHIPTPATVDWKDVLYIVTAHFAIITLVIYSISITALPSIYCKFKTSILLQFIFFNVVLAIFICDIRVFQCDAVHLLSLNIKDVMWQLNSKQAIFTYHKAIACILIMVFMLLTYKLNKWINKTSWLATNNIATKFNILLLISCILSLVVYQSSSTLKKQQLLAYTQHLNIHDSNSLIENAYKLSRYGKLQYPLQPLQTTEVTNPPNILIIAMDAWRADCFNEIDSPNLWQFAKQGTVFTKHFSGGNHTGSGLFSLFYGIPAIYRNRVEKQHTTALLFSRLKDLRYQLNIATYDGHIKNFIKTNQQLYFVNKKTDVSKIDQQITDNWIQNYNNLDKTKPWFAFVFYDSLHSLYFPENYSTKIKFDNGKYKEIANKYGKDNFIVRYKTTVHYIDSLANQILTQLKQSNDLENTIVIITADHGCEWDDNNQGQWGYGSNFTDCQVKVPLAIILPKQYQNKLINQQDNLTTHYDIVPTLMHNFLGVTNNSIDYSIGNDLLNNKQTQDWCLACSSAQYGSCSSAIIENNKALKIFPSGILNHLDNFNRLMFDKTINTKYLNKGIEYMTRFIKK